MGRIGGGKVEGASFCRTAHAATSDEIGVLEAAYRTEATEGDWLEGLVRAAAPLLDDGWGLAGSIWCDVSSQPRVLRVATVGGPPGLVHAVKDAYEGADDQIKLGLFRAAPVTSLSASGTATYVDRDAASQPLLRLGIRDCVTIFGADSKGGAVLQAYRRTPITPSRRFVALWSRIASHLGAAARVRSGLRALHDDATGTADVTANGDAILTPEGRVEHAEAPAKSAGKILARAVVAMNAARGGLREGDPLAAIEAWKALIAGRWSIVDHVDRDGKRFLVARKNEPRADGPIGVSLRERWILTSRARGLSLKLIAYDLGLSIAAVSRGLRSGMTKLGISRDSDLVLLLAARARSSAPYRPFAGAEVRANNDSPVRANNDYGRT